MNKIKKYVKTLETRYGLDLETYTRECGTDYFNDAGFCFSADRLTVCFDYGVENCEAYFRALESIQNALKKYCKRYGYSLDQKGLGCYRYFDIMPLKDLDTLNRIENERRFLVDYYWETKDEKSWKALWKDTADRLRTEVA